VFIRMIYVVHAGEINVHANVIWLSVCVCVLYVCVCVCVCVWLHQGSVHDLRCLGGIWMHYVKSVCLCMCAHFCLCLCMGRGVYHFVSLCVLLLYVIFILPFKCLGLVRFLNVFLFLKQQFMLTKVELFC